MADENGELVDSQVTTPSMYVLFNEAALEVVSAMDFTYAQENAGSVPVRAAVPVVFAPGMLRD